MATTQLKGHPVHTVGELPEIGSPAPAYTCVSQDLPFAMHGAAAALG
jgi:thioredoxin-dependent peroxiredoxin